MAGLGATSGRILAVEDDAAVRGLLVRLLQDGGYEVFEADDALGAMEHLGANPPDLVLLDVVLPGVDGLDLLRRIRMKSTVPIIMLTGRTDEKDRIDGLRSGADDYVLKPFSPGELVARVESVLRRSAPQAALVEQTVLAFDGLEIDPVAREVSVQGETVPVTAREFDLLAFLASAPRRCSAVSSCCDRCGTRRRSGRTRRPSPSTCAVCARRSRRILTGPAGW